MPRPRYPALWSYYKKQQGLFWTAEEVDLSKDKAHIDSLTEDERHYIKIVLAFFSSSDGIVGENITKFMAEVSHIKEAVFAYAFQVVMENIHNETYSLLIDTYISDTDEKNRLFNAIRPIDPDLFFQTKITSGRGAPRRADPRGRRPYPYLFYSRGRESQGRGAVNVAKEPKGVEARYASKGCTVAGLHELSYTPLGSYEQRR